MSEPDGIQAGLDQMHYELLDSGGLTMPVSEPATYEFDERATLNIDAFESKVDDYGFMLLDSYSQEKDSEDFYYTTSLLTDHFKEAKLKVFSDRAFVYPQENGIDTYEMSRIVHSIEDGFNASLTHDPN